MVAFLSRDLVARAHRVERLLRAHGFPGESSDLRAVAEMLGESLSVLDSEGKDASLESSLVAAWFFRFRMFEEAAGIAQSQNLPFAWVGAVAELVERGSLSTPLWHWVRAGLLEFGGRDAGSAPRWHLNGRLLAQTAEPFYELGECLVLQRLGARVLPLARACNGNLELLARKVESRHARGWVSELRHLLDAHRDREGWRYPPVVRVG